MGVAGRHAKDLHMHKAITVYQGGDSRWKGNTKVKFKNKWREAQWKLFNYFKGENTPFSLIFLSTTPDLNLRPQIPEGGRPLWDAQDGGGGK